MTPALRPDEDKARDRERVRDKHLKRRLKSKDKEDSLAGAPTLGSHSSDSDGDSASGDDDIGDSDGSDNDSAAGTSHGSEGSQYGMSDSSSDARNSPSEEEVEGRSRQGVRAKKARAKDSAGPSVEEQEDAVLAMLAARRGR